MILNKFSQSFFILCLGLLFSGCTASLYDLDLNSSNLELKDMVQYESADLGINFEYPDYYGEPAIARYEGKSGKVVVLSFVIDYLPEDPILVYVAGTSSDFEGINMFERVYYKGDLETEKLCENRVNLFSFVQYNGEKCGFVELKKNLMAANFNMAFVDAISNSIESLFVLNNPNSESEFTGLQFGFRVPNSELEFSRFDSASSRGDKAVQRLLDNLDQLKLNRTLKNELLQFRVLVESVE